MYKSVVPRSEHNYSDTTPSINTVSDLIIQYLAQLKVEYIFGIPGGAIEPLFNAIARGERGSGPRAIVARHETGAAFMAQGYSSETGNLGVCCATTGPGATNMITGVASAFQEEVPLLVLSAQTRLNLFGRRSFQDSSCTGINSLGMFQHCTRYNSLVSAAAQFETKLISAVMTAMDNPRGPVHLSIPTDVLASVSPVKNPSYNLGKLLETSSLMDQTSLDILLNEVHKLGKIVVVLGSGSATAITSIVKFAEWIDASMITTPSAKGLVNPYHPQYFGVFGFAGHHSARNILTAKDVSCVLAVGMAMNEWDTAGWDNDALLNKNLIHIDSVSSHFAQSPMAKLQISGDINRLFTQLLQRLQTNIDIKKERVERRETLWTDLLDVQCPKHKLTNVTNDNSTQVYSLSFEKQTIKPQVLMAELGTYFSSEVCFFSDVGNSSAWAIHYLHLRNPNICNSFWFRTSTQFAAMGWAIGTAVGAALGRLNKPVVCITGDGSVLMNGQEITVAQQENLNIVFVVLNDSALGMVKHGQRLNSAEAIAFRLPQVDFCLMAEAMGIRALQVRCVEDLQQLEKFCNLPKPGPLLLDVYIDSEEIPPIGDRMKVLGTSA